MDTEETKPSRIKKFLKIALGVLMAIFVLMGIAFVLTAMKNAREAKGQPSASVPQGPTEAEKLQILEALPASVSKDAIQKKGPPSANTSPAEKLRILEMLPPPPSK